MTTIIVDHAEHEDVGDTELLKRYLQLDMTEEEARVFIEMGREVSAQKPPDSNILSVRMQRVLLYCEPIINHLPGAAKTAQTREPPFSISIQLGHPQRAHLRQVRSMRRNVARLVSMQIMIPAGTQFEVVGVKIPINPIRAPHDIQEMRARMPWISSHFRYGTAPRMDENGADVAYDPRMPRPGTLMCTALMKAEHDAKSVCKAKTTPAKTKVKVEVEAKTSSKAKTKTKTKTAEASSKTNSAVSATHRAMYFRSEQEASHVVTELLTYIEYLRDTYGRAALHILRWSSTHNSATGVPAFAESAVVNPRHADERRRRLVDKIESSLDQHIWSMYSDDLWHEMRRNNVLFMYNQGRVTGKIDGARARTISSKNVLTDEERSHQVSQMRSHYDYTSRRLFRRSYSDLKPAQRKTVARAVRRALEEPTMHERRAAELYSMLEQARSGVDTNEIRSALRAMMTVLPSTAMKSETMLLGGVCPHVLREADMRVKLTNKPTRFAIIRRTLINDFALPKEIEGYYCSICGSILVAENDSDLVKFVNGQQVNDYNEQNEMHSLIWRETQMIMGNYVHQVQPINMRSFTNTIISMVTPELEKELSILEKSKTNNQNEIHDMILLYGSAYVYAILAAIMVKHPGTFYFGSPSKRARPLVRKPVVREDAAPEEKPEEKTAAPKLVSMPAKPAAPKLVSMPTKKAAPAKKVMPAASKLVSMPVKKAVPRLVSMPTSSKKGGERAPRVVEPPVGAPPDEKQILTRALTFLRISKSALIKRLSGISMDAIKHIFVRKAYMWARRQADLDVSEPISTQLSVNELLLKSSSYQFLRRVHQLYGVAKTTSALVRRPGAAAVDAIPGIHAVMGRTVKELEERLENGIRLFEDVRIPQHVDKLPTVRDEIIFQSGKYLAEYLNIVGLPVLPLNVRLVDMMQLLQQLRQMENTEHDKWLMQHRFHVRRIAPLVPRKTVEGALSAVTQRGMRMDEFFAFYRARCPVRGMHTGHPCTKCKLTDAMVEAKNEAYFKKYQSKMSEAHRDRQVSFSWAPGRRHVQRQVRAPKYTRSTNSINEWAKVSDQKYNLFLNIGLINADVDFEQVLAGRLNVSQDATDGRWLIAARRLRQYYLNEVRTINQLRQYTAFLEPNPLLKPIIERAGSPDLSGLSSAMLTVDSSVVLTTFDQMIQSGEASATASYMLGELAKLMLGLKTGVPKRMSDDLRRVTKAVFMARTLSIVESERLMSKPPKPEYKAGLTLVENHDQMTDDASMDMDDDVVEVNEEEQHNMDVTMDQLFSQDTLDMEEVRPDLDY